MAFPTLILCSNSIPGSCCVCSRLILGAEEVLGNGEATGIRSEVSSHSNIHQKAGILQGTGRRLHSLHGYRDMRIQFVWCVNWQRGNHGHHERIITPFQHNNGNRRTGSGGSGAPPPQLQVYTHINCNTHIYMRQYIYRSIYQNARSTVRWLLTRTS